MKRRRIIRQKRVNNTEKVRKKPEEIVEVDSISEEKSDDEMIEIIEDVKNPEEVYQNTISDKLDEFIIEHDERIILQITPKAAEEINMKEVIKKNPWKSFIRIWSKVKKELGNEAPIPTLKGWSDEVNVYSVNDIMKMREELESGNLIGIKGFISKTNEKINETHPYAKVKCNCKEIKDELERLATFNNKLVSAFMSGIIVYIVPEVGVSLNIEKKKFEIFRIFVDSSCKCRRTSVFGMTIPYKVGEISVLGSDNKTNSITAIFVGDAINVSPGERGIFYGFWALKPVKTQSVNTLISGVELKSEKYEPIFVVLGFDKEENVEEEQINEEEFEEAVKDPWFEEKLIESVFDDYFGFYFFKKALILAVINGAEKENMRSNIHVLAITDPGSGKTTAFQKIKKVAPKAVYISGSQSTRAGLIASIEKTENGWEIVAGALINASGGVAIIDEIDKLPKDDIQHLHEVMEEQVVHINKASIRNITLHTKVSIIAGGNPKYSRFDPRKTITENIDLPSAVLNRFDLIFAIRSTFLYEIFDEETADKLITKMIRFSIENKTNNKKKKYFSDNFVKRFLSYARSIKEVMWDEEAQKFLYDKFSELMIRNIKAELSGVPTPTSTNLRVLNSIIRLAEANAKLHLRRTVTKEDVEEAISLIQMSQLTLGILTPEDISEGTIANDNEWKKWKVGKLMDEIADNLIKEVEGKEVDEDELLKKINRIVGLYKRQLKELGVSENEIKNELMKMINEDGIITGASLKSVVKSLRDVRGKKVYVFT